jgi:hypothetical protein
MKLWHIWLGLVWFRYPEVKHKLCDAQLMLTAVRNAGLYMSVCPEVSGQAAWNCKWYSSLPLGAVVLLFCESV